MDKSIICEELEFAGQKVSFETGYWAPRANSSILARMGDTVLLATVTTSQEPSDRDYLPLQVEYIEKFYAGGIISGSRFIKRERFPSEEAIIKARQVDHSIRSLFPESFRHEIQIILTVLSYDDVNDPELLAVTAASTALMLSEIPFKGPIASAKIGLLNDELILNPSNGDSEEGDLNLMVSGNEEMVTNVEGEANEVSEEKVGEAIDLALSKFKPLLEVQKKLQKEAGREKREFEEKEVDEELFKKIEKEAGDRIKEVIYEKKGNIPGERRMPVINEIVNELSEKWEGEHSKSEIRNAVTKIEKKMIRQGILKDGKRPSGRKMDEIRDIDSEVSVLPRTHGSALFSRGITQALSIVTLGSTRLEQKLESYEGEESKRYMHHYNGPSFSYGEAGRYSYYPGRREIGHGHLAEKALLPVLPSEEEFPYTVRVVSEVLSQQGSSSMAATCGSTLALMDAGVPIKEPVGGIAIGLVTGETQDDYVLLSDIQDLEDFYGDMDFKVTGTKNGMTAIQMDNKLAGVKPDILKEALVKAKEGRKVVLEKMLAAINAPRKELSEYAPKITKMSINPKKIGELIGPGGKVIRGIIEETGVEVDVQEDGSVYISAVDDEAREKAKKMVNDITEEAEINKVYEGEVAKVMPFGVFVDISPSISGLVHVSEMSDEFVKDPGKLYKEGDKAKVKVIGIDDEGKVSLSMKRVKEG